MHTRCTERGGSGEDELPAKRMTRDPASRGSGSDAMAAATAALGEFRRSLPIHRHKEEIQTTVTDNQCTILRAETGSGKTTQVPQYLFELQPRGIIACSQPRRVAAISVADRVAKEMGVALGTTVGYSVRFDRCAGAATKVLYLTDGMLLREIIADPLLAAYSVVCVDEAHERSVDTDLLLALLKGILARREEFRVVVMSATLDTQRFQQYFKGAPALAIPGRVFPVSEFHLGDVATDMVQCCALHAAKIHCEKPAGDILVFLAGEQHIKQAMRRCQDELSRRRPPAPPATLLPLYGSLALEEQRRVFDPAPAGTRKIIFSTNIAETSVTIDGVVYVVDSGQEKQFMYDPEAQVNCLLLTQVSKASAEQRKGRAGRSQPGACYRMYPRQLFEGFMPQSFPEISRTNLDDVLLYMLALGIENVARFDFLDAPPSKCMSDSLVRLSFMEAVDEELRMTELGRQMARLPVTATTARMILRAGRHGCGADMVRLASMLESPRVFLRGEAQQDADAARARLVCPTSDHVTLLNVFDAFAMSAQQYEFCHANALNFQALRTAHRIWQQLWSICSRDATRVELATCMDPSTRHLDPTRISRAVLEGFFCCTAMRVAAPRAARSGGAGGGGLYHSVRSGAKAAISADSAVARAQPQWIVFNSMEMTSADAIKVSVVSQVEPQWLLAASREYFDPDDIDNVDIGEALRGAQAAIE